MDTFAKCDKPYDLTL